MITSFRLNRSGIRRVLTDNCRQLVDEVAAEVASNAEADGAGIDGFEVEVEHRTTDRAVARVTARPVMAQVKQGILTRAAASAGLEVKRAR